MILVKNNTKRPVHVNLGADKSAEIPTMKRVTLMPGNNNVNKAEAEALLNVPMVESMVDEGELVIRSAKDTDGPSAADKAKELLAADRKAAKTEPTPTPAQKAAATKAAKAEAAKAPAAPAVK